MSMIALDYFVQSPGYCGPASLKIAFSRYGIVKSEDELAAACGATRERGTTHAGIVAGIRASGFCAHEISGASIEDIRRCVNDSVPVIVGWHSEGDDHYSVAVEVTDTAVRLMDPEADVSADTGGSGIREMRIGDFERVWNDFDSGTNAHVERWMVGIERG